MATVHEANGGCAESDDKILGVLRFCVRAIADETDPMSGDLHGTVPENPDEFAKAGVRLDVRVYENPPTVNGARHIARIAALVTDRPDLSGCHDIWQTGPTEDGSLAYELRGGAPAQDVVGLFCPVEEAVELAASDRLFR